jgi:excisionase family DNA binding protein
MLDNMLTVPEAAALLGITPASVRQLIRRGRLTPVRRVGQLNLPAYQAEQAGKGRRGVVPADVRHSRRDSRAGSPSRLPASLPPGHEHHLPARTGLGDGA